jgi:hypothetical protein
MDAHSIMDAKVGLGGPDGSWVSLFVDNLTDGHAQPCKCDVPPVPSPATVRAGTTSVS